MRNSQVEFEVFTAVVMKSTIFWDIMQCSPLPPAFTLVSCSVHFSDPEDGLHGVISQKMVLFEEFTVHSLVVELTMADFIGKLPTWH
jgi:hypothetical protein